MDCERADDHFNRAGFRRCDIPGWPECVGCVMSEWISVEDRLPAEDQHVVFASFYGWTGAVEFDSVVAGQFWGGSFHPNTEGLEASNFDGGASITLEMKSTHWMPLPAAPKPEGVTASWFQKHFDGEAPAEFGILRQRGDAAPQARGGVMRETGWYRVKQFGKWIESYWDGDRYMWVFAGGREGGADSSWQEIDERRIVRGV